MTKVDGKCDNPECGKLTKNGKYWHTGHYLCLVCFSSWDKRDKEIRDGYRKELIGERIIKKDISEKKSGQTKLF